MVSGNFPIFAGKTDGHCEFGAVMPMDVGCSLPLFVSRIPLYIMTDKSKPIRLPNGKIEREKKTVKLMIELYCRHKLKTKEMPAEYRALVDYAFLRLDRCRHGDVKPACKKCSTHCYAAKQREMIREIMRWSGPRMLFYSPLAAIRHIFGW